MDDLKIGPLNYSPNVTGPPLIIPGPCVLEDETLILRTADALAAIARKLGVPYVFKSSFDKANRSSLHSERGPGLEDGLRLLTKVRSEVGCPVLTDIHEPHQAAPAGEVADCLQIPAFLCRQTDLLAAAARTGKLVNVKKGQFLSPEEMRHPITKVRESARGAQVCLTERGTFFGFGRLVVDFGGLPVMRSLGVPVIFDATHSVQRPGALGERTGGDRNLVPFLARAACATGVDGLFFEVHEDPDQAPSDGPNMVRLDQFEAILESLIRVRAALRSEQETALRE